MQTIGGNKSSAIVRKCMKGIFLDEVLINFSWSGTIEKKSIALLVNILTCIKEAIKRSIPAFNLADFEDKIKVWVRHADERMKELKRKNFVTNIDEE